MRESRSCYTRSLVLSIIWCTCFACLVVMFGPSANCQVWQSSGAELPKGKRPTSMTFERGTVLLSFDNGEIFRSIEFGKAWASVPAPRDIERPFLPSVAQTSGKWWAAGGAGLAYTDDGGLNWRIVSDYPERPDFATDVSLVGAGDTIVIITRGTILGSFNEGRDWQILASGSDFRFVRNGALINGALFVGSSDGTVFRKLAGESRLTKVSTLSSQVNEIGYNEGKLIAATNNGIHFSDDNGTTWTASSFSKPTSTMTTFGPYLFAATLEGVFRSENNFGTWIDVSTGLESREVAIVKHYEGTLLAVTWDGKVFRSEVPTSVAMDNSSDHKMILVDGSRVSTLTVLANGDVRVVNLQGVTLAKNHILDGDSFEIQLDQLPNGIYFVIEDGGEKGVQSFLLTR